jgi:hypothetical protein
MENTKVNTVEYKGVFIQNEIELSDCKVGEDVPLSFEGQNRTDKSLLVRAVPTCGCTTSERGEFKVGPGESFSIKGTFTKRNKPEIYAKRIHVFFGEKNTNDDYQKITVTFKGKIV